MNPPALLAASYLGPEGHGTHQTGLRPWPDDLQAAIARGHLAELHWTRLFTSDPSRFARMDLMCRLGLMATELMAEELGRFTPAQRETMGVAVETGTGSLATDVRFLQTPRPSLFTYTLPSTLLGEICIRYRFQGPVLCLIAPEPEATTVLDEGRRWVEHGDASACLCVGCEAVDTDLVRALPSAPELVSAGWHAGAVLLGGSPPPADLASAPTHPAAKVAPLPFPAGPTSLRRLAIEHVRG